MFVLKIVITILLVVFAMMFAWAGCSKDAKSSTQLGSMLLVVTHLLSVLAIWG